jgi:predicted GIY-YIG superfamily endonuclease
MASKKNNNNNNHHQKMEIENKCRQCSQLCEINPKTSKPYILCEEHRKKQQEANKKTRQKKKLIAEQNQPDVVMMEPNQPNQIETIEIKNQQEEIKELKQEFCYIYILKCKDQCWYIGKTAYSLLSLMKRGIQHAYQEGSLWTTLHPVVDVEAVIDEASPFLEDALTLEYMKRYGLDKVRGGQYVTVELNETQRNQIQHSIYASSNQCFHCHQSGHFIKQCPDYIEKQKQKPNMKCFTCHQEGHFAKNCTNKEKSNTEKEKEKPSIKIHQGSLDDLLSIVNS